MLWIYKMDYGQYNVRLEGSKMETLGLCRPCVFSHHFLALQPPNSRKAGWGVLSLHLTEHEGLSQT